MSEEQQTAQEKAKDLQERMEKLAKAGAHDPLMLLKMRLDLVTQLLVPDSLVGTLEGTWSQLVERYIEQQEQAVARSTLLEGVRK